MEEEQLRYLRVILVLFEGISGLHINWSKSFLYPINENHRKALRMKWLWKYANDKQLLWGKVIKAKYEGENRWMTKEVISPYGVNLWRSIRVLWDDFKINTKVKVKNGEKTSFWEDDWHEMGVLRNIYPDIHNLMLNQQRTIAELWKPDGWEINFRRQVNDWEITRVAEFLNTIGQFKGTQEGEDELWWKGRDKGIFKVGNAYRWLNNHNL
ncbi:hypothetical protein H5410_014827 [Solanum commersonii]|uniref:Uncharacterized protein n=1 Tax=Solanum commersonii TaxID=4109 RepID=A0A9J5ZSC7_SOLCO|nr:hypothetical protein H5410_014827 [Solanum commersonii]